MFNDDVKLAEAERNLRVKDLSSDIRTELGRIKSDIEKKDHLIDER